MFKFGKIRRRTPEISLIPVINVVFLLLVFFITQGSIKDGESLISAPVSTSGKAIGTKALEIIIDAEQIFVDAKVISEEQLKTNLTNLAKTDPEKEILLKVDANLDSTRFLQVLEIVKQAGIANLYMVTTPST